MHRYKAKNLGVPFGSLLVASSSSSNLPPQTSAQTLSDRPNTPPSPSADRRLRLRLRLHLHLEPPPSHCRSPLWPRETAATGLDSGAVSRHPFTWPSADRPQQSRFGARRIPFIRGTCGDSSHIISTTSWFRHGYFGLNAIENKEMAQSKDPSNDAINFCWGEKRGIGGSKRDIQFYESFMIDDVKYSLYDCVYLYKNDKSEPYIGKLVKIWEQPDSKKRVKILWFFQPSEIQNFLGDYVPLENEIFMSCGDGVGLFNVNPLEAVAGKCSVICTSKDERNRQPSKEELETADYIFHQTFNVQNYSISEEIDDKIAGVEVKFLLNKKEERNLGSHPRASNADDSNKDKLDIITQPSTERVDVLEGKKPIHLLEEKNSSKPKTKNSRDGEEGASEAENNVGSNLELGKPSSIVPDDRPSKRMRPLNNTIMSSSDLQNDAVAKKPKLELVVNGKIAHSHIESSDEIKTTQIKGKPVDLSEPSMENDKVTPSKDPSIDTVSKKTKLKSDGNRSVGNDILLATEISDKGKLTRRKTESLDTPQVSLEKPSCQMLEVTRRSNADRSKWFMEQSWDLRLGKAEEQGTLVFVENLDPSYTSSEVEDIIYRIAKKSCTARVIQQTAFQNPNYGQAYAIFKTKNDAESAVSDINNGCVLLPNGSPLICSRGMLKVPSPSIFGHLSIDKLKLQMQREEMKKAVSTAHCSQPNTIEYEMAMDWILLQERSSICFKELHEGQDYKRRQMKKSIKTR